MSADETTRWDNITNDLTKIVTSKRQDKNFEELKSLLKILIKHNKENTISDNLQYLKIIATKLIDKIHNSLDVSDCRNKNDNNSIRDNQIEIFITKISKAYKDVDFKDYARDKFCKANTNGNKKDILEKVFSLKK